MYFKNTIFARDFMKHRVQKTDAIYQLLTFILLASMSMPVAADDFHADSATVSLLTCSGGREVYEQYGHTAIRFNNNRGTDITFNYGVFDFNTPDFVYRFIKGETDYQLGIEPFEYFRSSYARRGSEVREQVLNLTSDEKVRLFQSLCVNFQPENRIYRYNFFYDNCTLRARDMIEGSVEGGIKYNGFDADVPAEETVSYRNIIHHYNSFDPWNSFGIDMLLGSGADACITDKKKMFAPQYLSSSFRKAKKDNGEAIVASDSVVVAASEDTLKPVVTVLTPSTVFAILLLLSVVACYYEFKKKTSYWIVNSIIYLAQGLAGCIIAFLSTCSVHPTVDSNWLVWVFNPLPLLAIPYIIYKGVKNRECAYHRCAFVVIALFLIAMPLIPQKFVLPHYLLVMLLLSRSAVPAYYQFLKYKK